MPSRAIAAPTSPFDRASASTIAARSNASIRSGSGASPSPAPAAGSPAPCPSGSSPSTSRSAKCASSRTLPGQSWRNRCARAASVSRGTGARSRVDACATRCPNSIGTSSRRSRSGGIRSRTAASRYSSAGSIASDARCGSSRAVAMTRTSTGTRSPPRAGSARVSISCASRSCNRGEARSISSRNNVPPSAATMLPSPTVANTSPSTSASGSAAQASMWNRRRARRPPPWISRASNSLPVPVSPSISRSMSAPASVAIIARSRRIAGDAPISASLSSASAAARRRRFSSASARVCPARVTLAIRSAGSNGLVRKSHAPAFSASTAIATSPCPVIRITGSASSRAASVRNSSIPDTSGRRTSVTTTPG